MLNFRKFDMAAENLFADDNSEAAVQRYADILRLRKPPSNFDS